MTFLSPAFLWGFLSLPLITALYLLRRRYQPRRVPSDHLWRQAQRDYAANHPFQRLKRNLLLPVQLLMAAVLTLALARPALLTERVGQAVLIFDLSASMAADEGGQTRMDSAKRQAEELLNGLHPGDTVSVLTAGVTTGQPLSASADRSAALRVIRGLQPTG
ncbi:MAG: BatA and WFA domain-containing protein, partial [Clostridia bacterium]|nr:BatA and WFA domain-containing protein [Clostridia bacterium]